VENVGQILALKTKGSTYTRRHLVNNFSRATYVFKWMAESRDMLAKCR